MKIKFTKALLSNFGSSLLKLTMKFFIFLCCTVTFALGPNKGLAQNSSITIKEDITLNVKQAFKLINKQVDYKFIYRNDLLKNAPELAFEKGEIKAGVLLEKFLTPINFTYEFKNKNTIVVKRKAIVATKVAASTIVQTQVSGIITDKNGEPLPGANVVEKGTTNGTQSDFDGNFSMAVANEEAVLLISYLGFVTQEVVIGSQSNISITMKEDSESLEEVVVVGYGTQKKATLTGSAVTIRADDLASIPVSQISNSLAGRAQGVQIVNSSGFAGSNSSINIRGTNLGALYVIDDIVSDKEQFDVLDPNEVESITFLKDAATAAIYGARSAGGVVVVRTKSGKPGKVNFTYSTNYAIFSPTSPIQDYTAEQEIHHRNNQQINNGNPAPYGQDVIDWAKGVNFRDINDEIFKDANSQQHSLTLNGGSEKVTYFFSTGFNKNQGNYDNTDFTRYNLRAKVDAQITDNLKFGTNISFNRRKTNRFYWPFDGDNGEGFTLSDFYRATFNWSRLYPHYTLADGTPTTSGNPDAFPVTSGGFNPVETIKSGAYRDIIYNTFNINANLEYKIPKLEGLSLKLLGNYRQNTFNRKDFVLHNRAFSVQTVGSTGADQFRTGPLDFNQINVNNLGRSFEGISEAVSLSESYQLNAFLNYNNSFGKHNVSSLLGYEIAESKSKGLSGSADDLLSREIDQILATSSSSERRNFNGGEGSSARLSYFGRLNYNFDERYIAEFSFRSDGSYKFPKDGRFGFFPSFSGAWRVSEEKFFDVSFVSNLKLRGSFGTTGFDGTSASPDPIAPFQFQNNFRRGGSYLFDDGFGAGITTPSVIPNPNITWETHRTTNIGLDLGLFNDKLSFEVDVFKNNIENILASPILTIPGTFGSGLPSTNIAEKEIKGFELSLRYKGKLGTSASYSIGGNMGYAKDKWIKYPESDGVEDINSRIGRSDNRLVGYISKGIIRNQATIDALPAGFTQFGRAPELGRILFEDINGPDFAPGPDGIINGFDRAIISDDTKPRINYGFNGDVKWNGFSMSFLLQGVAAYDKHVRTKNTGGSGVFQIDSRPYFELWTDAYSAANPDGQYPSVVGWGRPELGHGSSTFWNRNGAYLRLKNLSFAYAFPKELLNQAGIENLSIFVNGTNLFTISGFDEHDPEQDTLDSFPIMKSYSIGLKITL